MFCSGCLLEAFNDPEIGQKSSFLTSKSGGRHLLEHEHLLEQICITPISLPHMLYLEHCIISVNNSNFQIFSKKYFLHFNNFENIMKNGTFAPDIMENGTFAPQEQMFHFS